MASVTPRTNRDGTTTWRVQFRIDGKMSQESFVDRENPKRAELAAHRFGQLVDRVGGATARKTLLLHDLDNSLTLEEFTTQYLNPAHGHLSGVTPGTRQGYRQIADRSFLQILGQYPISSITKQDVASWVSWQEKQPSTRHRDQPLSAKTLRNYHGLLSAIMAAAVDAHLIDFNPAKGTALTRGRRQGVTFLTRDEFETLHHFIPAHYKPLVAFLAGTGMRWGEATALTWSDLDTSQHPPVATVNKAWQKGEKNKAVLGPPKTEKSHRTVALWDELVEALGPRQGGAELVFKGQEGKSRVWSYRFNVGAWTPAVNAANSAARCSEIGRKPIGKRPRIHDLRHSHASWQMARGVPLPYIQARLGHENITTTVDLYGHLLPDMQETVVAVVADVMSGVLPRHPVQPALTS